MAKKEKPEALVPVEEQPYPVPENWRWVRLGGIANSISDGSHNPPKDNGKGIPLLSATNIHDMSIDFESASRWITEDEWFEENKRTKIEKGDVLLTIVATIGRTAVVRTEEKFALQRSVAIVKSKVNPFFLSYFLASPYIQHIMNNEAKGTAQKGFYLNALSQLSCVVAPIDEQKRIVDRIESLFAKLDDAKEKAQSVVDGFEDRKAAILHKAFTGELTEKWRKRSNLNNDKWETIYWGDLIESIEAGKNWNALGRPPEQDEFGVVKVSAVTWGEFNELESKTCEEQSQWNEKVQIKEEDFLFSRANTIQLVGNCVIVKHISKRLMLSDKILRLRHNDKVVPAFVLYFTRTDLYRKQIEQLASGNQDGMRNISQKNMGLVQIPVPLIKEQREIVRILSRQLEDEIKAKETAEQVVSQIETMKKSILAKAFRGELGTNDPTESPVDIG